MKINDHFIQFSINCYVVNVLDSLLQFVSVLDVVVTAVVVIQRILLYYKFRFFYVDVVVKIYRIQNKHWVIRLTILRVHWNLYVCLNTYEIVHDYTDTDYIFTIIVNYFDMYGISYNHYMKEDLILFDLYHHIVKRVVEILNFDLYIYHSFRS